VLVVLFRSRVTEAAGEDYRAMAEEMLERARAMPGFVDFQHYEGEGGERISVIHWRDEATLAAWREDVRHRVAQRLGRERWYAFFSIEVAEVVRGQIFERPAKPPAPGERPAACRAHGPP
jgi:heme-degrading monooxygenase HmoA